MDSAGRISGSDGLYAGHLLEALPRAEHGGEGAAGMGHFWILAGVAAGAMAVAALVIRPWTQSHKSHAHGVPESSI